jgi:hypothetical protein
MRHPVAILAALVAIAASASGAAASVIQLPLHGTVALAGSNVRCGSGTVSNLIFIDCGIAGPSNEPKKGGFVALMTQEGRVAVLNSTNLTTVFSRSPSSAWVGSPVRPGDTIVLPGTSISCNATKPKGEPTITCFFLDTHGIVLVSSTSFRISDAALTTFSWNELRQAKLLRTWRENG